MVKENINNFASLDIRVGEIIDVQDFPEAMNPSYILEINFGENIGIKKTRNEKILVPCLDWAPDN